MANYKIETRKGLGAWSTITSLNSDECEQAQFYNYVVSQYYYYLWLGAKYGTYDVVRLSVELGDYSSEWIPVMVDDCM